VKRKRADPGAVTPGAVLKAARAAKGLTLARVSDRTGLPISTLSKIENGKMGLSYDKLTKLGSGLGLDIAQLLAGNHRPELAEPEVKRAPPPQVISGRRAVTRKGEGQRAETPTYRFNRHAVELLGKAVEPVMIEVAARSIEEFGALIRHSGEEFAYVVEGEIEFHCEFYAPTRLKEGDSVYFDAAMGHAYVAASTGRCRVLSVSSGAAQHPVRAAHQTPAATPLRPKSRRAPLRASLSKVASAA